VPVRIDAAAEHALGRGHHECVEPPDELLPGSAALICDLIPGGSDQPFVFLLTPLAPVFECQVSALIGVVDDDTSLGTRLGQHPVALGEQALGLGACLLRILQRRADTYPPRLGHLLQRRQDPSRDDPEHDQEDHQLDNERAVRD